MMIPNSLKEIIDEIREEYQNLRINGQTRENAVSELKNIYQDELNDEEDRVSIMIGMCLALCKKKELISSLGQETIEEITNILSRTEIDDLWDYWVQISVKNKKEEQEYELEKIGNFTGVKFPSDQIKENPLTAIPMHGKRMNDEPYPQYEEHICRIYRRYGKYLRL